VWGEPIGDRVLNQWQWPLSTGGAWRQGRFRQEVTGLDDFCLALGERGRLSGGLWPVFA